MRYLEIPELDVVRTRTLTAAPTFAQLGLRHRRAGLGRTGMRRRPRVVEE